MASAREIFRKLTGGEELLVLEVYKTSVNADLVRVSNTKYSTTIQSDYTLMTPDGNIYAASYYADDFSTAGQDKAATFIHEMAHVWQKQNDVLDPVSSAIKQWFWHKFDYNKAYYYTLDAKKDLLDYKIEQQAQIIQDYYQIFHQKRGPDRDYLQNVLPADERNKLYQAVLARFLTNPKYPSLKSAAQGASGFTDGYVGGGLGGGGAKAW